MERIFDNINTQPNIDLSLEVYRLVYDGPYLYKETNLDVKRDTIALRFSFITDVVDGNYGYMEIPFRMTQDSEDYREYILPAYNNISNKINVTDFGIGVRILSNVYKDDTGYFYICKSIVRDGSILKIYLPEKYVLMIEVVCASLSYNMGIPESGTKFIPGFGVNSNELAFIDNIITMNYMEEKKDLIKINGVYINTRTQKNKQGEMVQSYHLDCIIPSCMYSVSEHWYEKTYDTKEGLRVIITVKLPKKYYRRMSKQLKSIRRDYSELLNMNTAYVLQPNIAYAYYKPYTDKFTAKVLAVLTGYGGYDSNSYIKFNFINNFQAFLSYFVDYLNVGDIVEMQQDF